MMNDEIVIIEKLLSEMSGIFNVLPGEIFRLKSSDTLLILQRRMNECDLRNQLAIYNEIFTKADGVSVSDLCVSVVAFVKIKVLVEGKKTDFEPRLVRELDKEFKNQKVKIENVIHLSKVNAMTADVYQKEHIDKTLKKNEAFLSSFSDEIRELSKIMEKEPEIYKNKSLKTSEKEQAVKTDEKVKSDKKSPLAIATDIITAKKNQKDMDRRLKDEEKKQARTMCVEIPYYDKTLVYTEKTVCKDIPTYSIYKRKNNIFFGFSKNGNKGCYDNSDLSLVELTQTDETFLQFMAADILDDTFEIKPFTKDEKKSLQMYFNFISYIFEKQIGVTLTVMEYMNFKQYYNKLVMTMFDMEEKFRSDYYRALTLADTYTSYMECYGLVCSDDKKTVVKNIMEEKNLSYIDDLELLLSHHIVDKKAKDRLVELIHKIKYFADEKTFEKGEMVKEKEVTVTGHIDLTPKVNEVQIFPEDHNDENIVTADDMAKVQIKIQFLNKDHVIVDEALFVVSNVKKAVFDYLNKDAYIKKIGLMVNEKDVFLYSSKNGSLSVPLLTEQVKRIKGLNRGTQGELIEFYEDKIKRTMIEFTS